MCGITGFIDFKHHTSSEVLDAMVSTLEHRGPDDKGSKVFGFDKVRVGLGQTRLSILDLSSSGHQPMVYNNFTITFNGEVYNYREIRKELSTLGHHFQSNTDTEVILHAFEEWGIACVHRFIGMFAFVIYNSAEKVLYGFRDRAGVKPFYYYRNNGLLLFGSELKAFYQHPKFEKQLDIRSVRTYFDFGYIPAPYAIFANTCKLEPGHYFKYDIVADKFDIKQYWDVLDIYSKPKLTISYQDAREELHDLLKSAFAYRMIADVPVGIFLSGGYDSTAVAAILQKNTATTLKTFTIGFAEGNNEAPFARATAEHLGTEHYELICTTKEAQDIIPQLPFYYDEPFADSSAIPTMLVSKFARAEVTVALSADGGDEVFAGYQSYKSLLNKLNYLDKIPSQYKAATAKIFTGVESLISSSHPATKHKVYGISRALNKDKLRQARELFRIMNSLPLTYSQKLFNQDIITYQTKYSISTVGFSNEVELAMAIDYQMYLPNDILTKVDRATMSVSLEGREPLLDHRIIEFVAQLPLMYKYDGDTSKRILKDIVHKYLPKEMMDRTKAGFSLPIHSWLKGDLAYLIDEYLNENFLEKSGLFDVDFLLKQIKSFQEGKLHYKTLIWKVLMFQMWYRQWMD